MLALPRVEAWHPRRGSLHHGAALALVAVTAAVWLGNGAFIYYNANILNVNQTLERLAADPETPKRTSISMRPNAIAYCRLISEQLFPASPAV